jgi:hypothetical protein
MARENEPVRPAQIKVLQVYFRNNLGFDDLPAFRAAISNVAGHEHILFHHHDGEGFLYKYPKIQYKISSGRPMLYCIETAIEELSHFFSKQERFMVLHGKRHDLEVTSMRQHYYSLKVNKSLSKYSIRNWLPLNQDNFRKYQQLTAVKDKIIFLEKILTANILSFAKGVGWKVPEEIKLNLLEVPFSRTKTVKDVKMQVFSALFETNVFLPNYTGLGKLSSIGYGTVKNIN